MTLNPSDIEEKRNFIFRQADFIMENEDLFKTGTFKLIEKVKKKFQYNNISVKEREFIIKKKKIDDNIELLEQNIIEKPKKVLEKIMKFNIRKSFLNPEKLKMFQEQNNISNNNNKNNNKSRNIPNTLLNISSMKSFENSIISNKIKLLKNKKNNKVNFTSYDDNLSKTNNIFPHLSLNESQNKKQLIKDKRKIFTSYNKKKKIKINYNKTIDSDNIINDLRRTQLRFILKNQKKLNKQNNNSSINNELNINSSNNNNLKNDSSNNNDFYIAYKNYFKSHNHNDYFQINLNSNNNRFINVLNEYDESKKILPKMKRAINEIKEIEGENEKRKIRLCDDIYCINEKLNQLKDNNLIKMNLFKSSNSVGKMIRKNIKIKTTFKQRNIVPINNNRRKNNIELMLTDIEKQNNLVNQELQMWKKI